MGLVILGQAITTHPELTDHNTWVSYEITPEDNANWSKFCLRSQSIGHIPVSKFLVSLNFIVKTVQDAILAQVHDAPNTILAGTMRLCITMAGGNDVEEPKLQAWLMWASMRKEDSKDE